ncbi:MAG: hypothetical protein AABY93_18080 [Bacteroidota bacterium]
MKKHINLLFVLSFIVGIAHGQKDIYTTTGGEWIFSWADAQQQGLDIDVITRFSPVINIQSQVHMDKTDKLGFFTGLNLRNVGFIWEDPVQPETKHKARAYTVGVPVGFKVGDMTGIYLFGGYELELPFNYKEKTFINEEKDKEVYWFSNRIPGLYQSLFLGVQTPYGTQIKFKYYLTNFFNKSYTANDGNGGTFQPYAGFDANVFYVSLSFQILKGTNFYYSRDKK